MIEFGKRREARNYRCRLRVEVSHRLGKFSNAR